MSISLYDVSIPVFTLTLNNLSAILDKAESHGEAKKVDPKVIPQARLIVDMLPLTSQVQIACDTAKGAAARLAGVAVPKHEDTEATLAELKTRVAKTLDFIKTIKPEQLQGAETREILAVPADDVEIQRSQLPHEFRATQFLLSCDDGIRVVTQERRRSR